MKNLHVVVTKMLLVVINKAKNHQKSDLQKIILTYIFDIFNIYKKQRLNVTKNKTIQKMIHLDDLRK